MPTKHSWDDDEETIVNFTPKSRAPQARPAENPPTAHPQDAQQPGVEYDASAGIEGATVISGPAAPVLTGAETPPGSDMYWLRSARPPSPFAGPDAAVAGRPGSVSGCERDP